MKALIPSILFAVLANLITLPVLAQGDIEVPLTNPGQPGKLIINAMFSDEIEIRTHNRDNVIINYDGDIEDHDNEAVRNGMRRISGGGFGMEVTEDDNEVRIETGPISQGDLEMVVFVPRNFSLKLSTVQGDVLVNGLQGELEISAVNGDIELMEVSGTVLINSVNGDMDIEFIDVKPDAPMSFTGVNGDIEVAFPGNARFTAKMKTEWGDVYSNFDMDIEHSNTRSNEDDNDGQYRVAINKWVIGKVNGGGPEFLFKTLHGDIYIRNKDK
ncbi:DUF4097 family beta strand repeat-containing protein [Gracilimonas mengyeensis]|nr:DUF4097 family beta strand repeat-containing protein [Gracilimonas mengyeensis]